MAKSSRTTTQLHEQDAILRRLHGRGAGKNPISTRFHEKKKPHSCPFCGMKLSTKQGVKIHMKQHKKDVAPELIAKVLEDIKPKKPVDIECDICHTKLQNAFKQYF